MVFATQYFKSKIKKKKIAVLGGSGSYDKNAIRLAQILTADLKYHQFYEAENRLLWQILDILRANAIQKIILIFFGKKSLILQSFYLKKIQIQLSTYRIWRIRKN
jgi:hypothetical protein